jgi:hypothetical protein
MSRIMLQEDSEGRRRGEGQAELEAAARIERDRRAAERDAKAASSSEGKKLREDEAVTFLRSLGYTVERSPVTPPLPSIAYDHCSKPIIIEQTQRLLLRSVPRRRSPRP